MFGRGRREESIISMQENVDSENKEYNEYDCMIIQTLRASTFRLRKRSYHPSNDPRGQRTIKTKKICIIIMIIYSVKFCFDIRHSKQTSMHRGEGKICHWKLESIYLQFNLKKHQVFPFPQRASFAIAVRTTVYSLDCRTMLQQLLSQLVRAIHVRAIPTQE